MKQIIKKNCGVRDLCKSTKVATQQKSMRQGNVKDLTKTKARSQRRKDAMEKKRKQRPCTGRGQSNIERR